ncbi:MAG: hypothetical protein Q8O89_00165 [Nanoarchaeota archaeon]|nr:hypothetical protein [Nanoarchaeota archaeon]
MKRNKKNSEKNQNRSNIATPATTFLISSVNKEIDSLIDRNFKSNSSNEGFVDGLKAAKELINKNKNT